MSVLRSPQTVVHLVTLLEEMPVQETVDAAAELRALGLEVGGVVVNDVTKPLLRVVRPAAVSAAARSTSPSSRGRSRARPRSPPRTAPSRCSTVAPRTPHGLDLQTRSGGG